MKSTKVRLYLPAAVAVAALVALVPVVQAAQVPAAKSVACDAVVGATWKTMNELHRRNLKSPELWHRFFYVAPMLVDGTCDATITRNMRARAIDEQP